MVKYVSKCLLLYGFVLVVNGCIQTPADVRASKVHASIIGAMSYTDFANCSVQQLDEKLPPFTNLLRIDENKGYAEIIARAVVKGSATTVYIVRFILEGPTEARAEISVATSSPVIYPTPKMILADVLEAVRSCARA